MNWGEDNGLFVPAQKIYTDVPPIKEHIFMFSKKKNLIYNNIGFWIVILGFTQMLIELNVLNV